MTQTITFTVYGDPVAQPRAGERGEWKTSQYGGQYKEKFDPAARKKFNFAAKAMEHRPVPPIDGPTRVDITWYFKRPKSHFGRRDGKPYLRDDAPIWYALHKRHDRDNLDKFVLDALTGAGWFVDDGIICAGELRKLYTDHLPRTEVTITPLTNERNHEHGKKEETKGRDRNDRDDQPDHAQQDRTQDQLFGLEG